MAKERALVYRVLVVTLQAALWVALLALWSTFLVSMLTGCAAPVTVSEQAEEVAEPESVETQEVEEQGVFYVYLVAKFTGMFLADQKDHQKFANWLSQRSFSGFEFVQLIVHARKTGEWTVILRKETTR